MTDKIRKLMRDPMAYIFIKSFQLFSSIYIYICSIYTFFLARLKGIQINEIPKCNGVPYLMRCPDSSIIIGEHFTINSSFKSNNIGMFSRSRITTKTKKAVIEIGEYVGMSAVTISASEKISIGKNTLIGGNVLITDSDWHSVDPIHRLDDKSEYVKTAPIVIGENVFIGTRSIILKGTIIGNNSVIGAGSVVSGVIPDNVVACGNPCKIIKKL